MSERSLASAVLGAAAVVLLSGVAAYVGATMAHRDPVAVAPPPAATGADAARIEDLERRLALLEERVGEAETIARTALDLAKAAADRNAAPGAGPAPSAPDGPEPRPPNGKPAEPPPNLDDGAGGQMAEVQKVYRATSKGFLVYTMSLFSDATKQGAENRTAQSIVEAQNLVNRFAIKGDDNLATVRRIFAEQWERGARDIGPIVRDGLEKADVSTVRQRMHDLRDEADRRLRPLFDDETWKDYQEYSAGARKVTDGLLDEYEKARLNK